MLYNIIEIVPNKSLDEWVVKIKNIDGDRESSKPIPNSGLGFMYYSRKMSKAKAFNILKNSMIKRHEEEIRRLNKSLNKLKQLEIE